MWRRQRLDQVCRLVVRQRPGETTAVRRPAQMARHQARRRQLQPAEFAEDPAGEAVDDQLVGGDLAEGGREPPPEGRAVVAEPPRHLDHRHRRP